LPVRPAAMISVLQCRKLSDVWSVRLFSTCPALRKCPLCGGFKSPAFVSSDDNQKVVFLVCGSKVNFDEKSVNTPENRPVFGRIGTENFVFNGLSTFLSDVCISRGKVEVFCVLEHIQESSSVRPRGEALLTIHNNNTCQKTTLLCLYLIERRCSTKFANASRSPASSGPNSIRACHNFDVHPHIFSGTPLAGG
jgi:hypothetical protein